MAESHVQRKLLDMMKRRIPTLIAVIQCCSQQIGQRFAVGVAGESGGRVGLTLDWASSFAHSLRHNSQFFGLFHPVASERLAGPTGVVGFQRAAAREAAFAPQNRRAAPHLPAERSSDKPFFRGMQVRRM